MHWYNVYEWFDDVQMWRGSIYAASDEDAVRIMQEIDKSVGERLSAERE